MSKEIPAPAWAMSAEVAERLRTKAASVLKPVQPDEFTVYEYMVLSDITEDQARKLIREMLARGEIEAVERLRYRKNQKPQRGNMYAYRFINGKTQNRKQRDTTKKDSHK